MIQFVILHIVPPTHKERTVSIGKHREMYATTKVGNFEMSNNPGPKTFVSKLLKLSISTCFLPVKVDFGRKNIQYKSLSFKSFRYWTTWNLPNILNVLVMMAIVYMDPSLIEKFSEYQVKFGFIDSIASSSIGFLTLSFYLVPLTLAASMPNISSIALSDNLNWPRNGKKIGCFSIFYVLSAISFQSSGLLAIKTGFKSFLILITSSSFVAVFTAVMFSLPMIFLCSWLDHFSDLCKDSRKGNQSDIRFCLKNYKMLQRGLGNIFFALYVLTQIYVIFTTFLTFNTLLVASARFEN